LEILRDYEVDDSIHIYTQGQASAPRIWAWEASPGIPLFEENGFVWASRPTMEVVGDQLYRYSIPKAWFTPGFPYALNLIIGDSGTIVVDPVRSVIITGGVVEDYSDEDTTAPTLTTTPSVLSTEEASLTVTLNISDDKDPSPRAYYTIDGTTPTLSSPLYTDSIVMTQSTSLKVLVIDESGNSRFYDLPVQIGVVLAPVVSANPGTGTFQNDSLTITMAVTGTAISSATYSTTTGLSGSYVHGQQLVIDTASLIPGDSFSLTLEALGAGGEASQSYTYTRSEPLVGFFATNPNGQKGKPANIVIDGSFDDWTNDMIVAQGVANDDPRIFKGSHEGPVYDLYALYAAWDDDNLYLMWQYTNVTDVVDPAQGFPISDNGKPWNGNIPIIIALNTDPSLNVDGIIEGTETTVWTDALHNTFDNGMDRLLMFSSKPGVGEPAVFVPNANGNMDYEEENIRPFEDFGITYLYGDGFKPETMMGINANGWAGYSPADLQDPSLFIDFLTTSHDVNQNTMYEMKIPFAAIDMDRSTLESQGLGVMLISTFGQSGIGALPNDPTSLDNALEPYSADSSTSVQWQEWDNNKSKRHALRACFYDCRPG